VRRAQRLEGFTAERPSDHRKVLFPKANGSDRDSGFNLGRDFLCRNHARILEF
jgi:hypothetical protein